MYEITDHLYNENFKQYSILHDLILWASIIIFYYIGNKDAYFHAIKFIFILILLRILFNTINPHLNIQIHKSENIDINENSINENNTKKDEKYYQVNIQLAIFTILILLTFSYQLLPINIYMTIGIILAYLLFSSVIGYTFSVDNLNTVILSWAVLQIPFLH